MSKKLTIEEMQEIALKRGGWCLSPEYINSDTKHWWQCGNGHIWGAKPNEIKNQNHWCPYCSGKAKKTIEDMHELAKKNNGKCLSKEYVNNHTKLEWECTKGHKFWMLPNNVQQGGWCSICAPEIRAKTKMNKSFERVKKIAIDKGGICLSKSYDIPYSKLKFRCKNGHEWETGISSILNGNWCRECYNESRRGVYKYNIVDLNGRL